MKREKIFLKAFCIFLIILFTLINTCVLAEYEEQNIELSKVSEKEEEQYFIMDDTMAFYGTESSYENFKNAINQKETSNTEFEAKNNSNLTNVGAITPNGTETDLPYTEIQDLNTLSFSIDNDKGAIYFFFKDCVKRLDLETKEYKTAIIFEKECESIRNFYVLGDVIYIMQSVETPSTAPMVVQGYDLIKKEKVFEQTFDGLQDSEYRVAQFLVDDNLNFYFLVAKGTISSFNKNGEFIQTISTGYSAGIILTQVSSDNKTILYRIATDAYDAGGYVPIDNGKFVGITTSQTDGYLYFFSQAGFTSTLTFNDEATFAFNSEGYIFTYSHYRGTSNIVSFLHTCYMTEPDSTNVFKKIGCFDGDYIYIYSKENSIIKYDTKDQSPVASLEIELEKADQIQSVNIYNNKLYILLSSRYTHAKSLHEVPLTDFKTLEVKNLSNHITYTHTKEEIIQKYRNAQKKFDYSNTIYSVAPVTEAPFGESILKDEVKQDGLNKINYYRWLTGLNEMTLNEERMYKNARGALWMYVTGKFTHYPSVQPEGMSDEFYADAKEGVGADTTYSGNISAGEANPSDTIIGYVWDNYNLDPNVGHRTSMLDPTADKISFGQCYRYNATSTYYATTDLNNNQGYYAYPSAGYFPLEEMPYTMSKDLRWSITLYGDYLANYRNMYIKLTHNNVEYVILPENIDLSYATASFLIPNELKEAIVGEDGYIKEGEKVKVELTNGLFLTETNQKVVISYTTEFIKANIIEPTEINTYIDTENVTVKDCGIGAEFDVAVEFVPSNTTYQDYTIEIEDSNIVSYNSTTKKIKGENVGTTNLYVKDYQGKIVDTVVINVLPIEPLSVDTYIDSKRVDTKECTIGKEYDVVVIFVPYDTTYQDYTIEMEDENIATYDSNTKKILAKSIGTTKMYVKDYQGKVVDTVTINVNEYNASVYYKTHVQNVGWQYWAYDGEMSGTSGMALRLEGIVINLDKEDIEGGIEYRTHVQNLGWQDYVSDGKMSGTSGMALRLEAIQIRLTGKIAEKYDVYYRVHAQNFGWLDWAKNGEESGTVGYGFRLEGIEIKLVRKGNDAPGKTDFPVRIKEPNVEYTTHVQNVGWQDYVSNGKMAGTSGKALRLEGIKIRLSNQRVSGNIEYSTHIQNIGWQDFVKNDEISGTSGRSLRLEAIKIKLTDKLAELYDVYYRVHAEKAGWLGWAKNGEKSGTAGYGLRLEGIEIRIVPKGSNPPGNIENAFIRK